MSIKRATRQADCSAWVRDTFGDESVDSVTIRAKRFIEEALELAQACGLTVADVNKQANRVYSRPIGERAQEAGGVGVTLLSLCAALGVSADDCERQEMERCASKPTEHWKARDAAKRQSETMTRPTSDAHDWLWFGKFECCRLCGIVRRSDDKNKPCKGSVKVGPR